MKSIAINLRNSVNNIGFAVLILAVTATVLVVHSASSTCNCVACSVSR